MRQQKTYHPFPLVNASARQRVWVEDKHSYKTSITSNSYNDERHHRTLQVMAQCGHLQRGAMGQATTFFTSAAQTQLHQFSFGTISEFHISMYQFINRSALDWLVHLGG